MAINADERIKVPVMCDDDSRGAPSGPGIRQLLKVFAAHIGDVTGQHQ